MTVPWLWRRVQAGRALWETEARQREEEPPGSAVVLLGACQEHLQSGGEALLVAGRQMAAHVDVAFAREPIVVLGSCPGPVRFRWCAGAGKSESVVRRLELVRNHLVDHRRGVTYSAALNTQQAAVRILPHACHVRHARLTHASHDGSCVPVEHSLAWFWPAGQRVDDVLRGPARQVQNDGVLRADNRRHCRLRRRHARDEHGATRR